MDADNDNDAFLLFWRVDANNNDEGVSFLTVSLFWRVDVSNVDSLVFPLSHNLLREERQLALLMVSILKRYFASGFLRVVS